MADMDVDVDMPAVAPKKDDLKKRFEVKKVCTIPYAQILHVYSPACSGMQWPCGHGVSSYINFSEYDLTESIFRRHCCRQLCNLPQSYHGPLSVAADFHYSTHANVLS
jgi:hypothetical protein